MSDILINVDFSVPSKPRKALTRKSNKLRSYKNRKTQNWQSDQVVHLNYTDGPKRQVHGNAKHQRFLQKRKYLDQPAHRPKNKEAHYNASLSRDRVTGAMPSPPATASSLSSSGGVSSIQQSERKATSDQSTAEVSKMQSFNVNPSKYVAIDCEMVGTGKKGCISELARCSVISYHGDVIYDKYIRPTRPVTDYRTRWSGIRCHHLLRAISFPEAKTEILKLLKGKVVVGHSVQNDFKVLSYVHPAPLTRDIAKITLLNKKAGFPENQTASLKRLSKTLLSRNIQVGFHGHSSVEDAKATMDLYKLVVSEWEMILSSTAGNCSSSYGK